MKTKKKNSKIALLALIILILKIICKPKAKKLQNNKLAFVGINPFSPSIELVTKHSLKAIPILLGLQRLLVVIFKLKKKAQRMNSKLQHYFHQYQTDIRVE